MKQPLYLQMQQLHHITTDVYQISCGAQTLLTNENFTQPFGLPNLKVWNLSYSSRSPEIITEYSHRCNDGVKYPKGRELALVEYMGIKLIE